MLWLLRWVGKWKGKFSSSVLYFLFWSSFQLSHMNYIAFMRVAQIEVDVDIFYKIPQDLHRQIFFHR